MPLALFVVQFDEENSQAAKATLLASSPLGAWDISPSVNNYTDGLDPCNQASFKTPPHGEDPSGH